MIKQEQITVNGKVLTRTYSDAGKYIIQEQTGNKYIEAVDILTTYTYIESVEDIPKPEEQETKQEGE